MGKRIGGEGGALAHWCCLNRRNSATMPADSNGKYRLTWRWFREIGRGTKREEGGEERGVVVEAARGLEVAGGIGGLAVVHRGTWAKRLEGEEDSDPWGPSVSGRKEIERGTGLVSLGGRCCWAGLGCSGPKLLSLFLLLSFSFFSDFLNLL
jgi:hypothetical protein